MALRHRSSKTARILTLIGALVIVLAGMHAAKTIVVSFLIALFIAIISASPLYWLKEKKFPPWLALVVVITGILFFGLIIAGLIGSSVSDFSLKLPFYEAKLKQQTASLLSWMEGFGVDVSRLELTEILNPGAAMKLAATTLNELRKVLTNYLLITLMVIFMLLEASIFREKLGSVLPDPENSMKRLTNSINKLNKYMAIKTSVSLATGILVGCFLSVAGVDYFLLWGLLAFLLNYIPTLGSFIAAIPAILLAIVQLGPGEAVIIAMGYLVINTLMGNIIEPRFLGKGLGLSTLVVFFSLIFWGFILGPVGMLLAVPLTMAIKIAAESSQGTQWISLLLGSERPVVPKPVKSQKPHLKGVV